MSLKKKKKKKLLYANFLLKFSLIGFWGRKFNFTSFQPQVNFRKLPAIRYCHLFIFTHMFRNHKSILIAKNMCSICNRAERGKLSCLFLFANCQSQLTLILKRESFSIESGKIFIAENSIFAPFEFNAKINSATTTVRGFFLPTQRIPVEHAN